MCVNQEGGESAALAVCQEFFDYRHFFCSYRLS